MSKRHGKQWNMPKNLNPWEKDLQTLIGQTVDMEHRLGKQVNFYKHAKVLNVDIKMGNRFKIEQSNGKTRVLIGGTYDILLVPHDDGCSCPEALMVDYSEKAKAK